MWICIDYSASQTRLYRFPYIGANLPPPLN